jgi:hypothetical protein
MLFVGSSCDALLDDDDDDDDDDGNTGIPQALLEPSRRIALSLSAGRELGRAK